MTKTISVSNKTHKKIKRDATDNEMTIRDFVERKLGVIVIATILSLGSLGLIYADGEDHIALPVDQPFDESYCTFLSVGDHVIFTCSWKWFLADEIMAELDPEDYPKKISDIPQHNIDLAKTIKELLEEPIVNDTKDQMDLGIQEFIAELPEPLTFEERKIKASIEKLDECLRGLGAWQAYQAQTDIEYYVDESRYSFSARDNLSQNIHIKRILLAIEECDIMRTYERMNLIGAYELNKVLADISGLDYLGRTAEHELANKVTDQSQEGMVHTDPVTEKDIQKAIEEAEKYLREEAPWIDPTLGCIATEDDPDRCVNRGGQTEGLKCQAKGQPTEFGEYPDKVCPLDDYNQFIIDNFETITMEDILLRQCDQYLGQYEHKRFTVEFPAWLNHCPIPDEEVTNGTN